MEVTSDWLEVVLQKCSNERSIAKVLDYKVEENFVSKGDNYSSDIVRVVLTVLLGSGKTAKRSLVIKSFPKTPTKAALLKQLGTFDKEIKVFRDVLEPMRKLASELGEDPFWPECIDASSSQIVFQDLTELGYTMQSKREGLDRDHSLMVLRYLGRFHAMSVVMKDRGILNPQEFSVNPFTMYVPETKQSGIAALMGLATVIEQTWDADKKCYADKIRSIAQKAPSKIHELFTTVKPDSFQVLNHGDCWTNNIMFKHNDKNSPTSLRFVDFQLPIFQSYAMDLSYLLVSSIQVEVLHNPKELLTAYQSSLAETFQKLHHEVVNLPSVDDIQAELDRYVLYIVMLGATVLPFFLTENNNEPDLEKAVKTSSEGKIESYSLDASAYTSKEYTKKMQYTLKVCDKKGAFNL